MTVNNKDICICNHIRYEHTRGHESGRFICLVCYSNMDSLQYHEFKLDNLKYLEQQYEESTH